MRTKQILESKMMIVKGLFSLIKKTSYDSITMSDIANEANVSRMTLYRHFSSKKDILQFFMMNIISKIDNTLNEMESPTLELMLLERNKVIYNNKLLRLAYTNKDLEVIFQEVINHSEKLYHRYIPKTKFISKYKYQFVIGGIKKITRDWVYGGMKESPELITKEILILIKLLSNDMEVKQ